MTFKAHCPFCERDCPRLEEHHLTPREYGGKETVDICRDCHGACHECFSNKELRDYYHTRARLFSNDRFRKMIRFIAKQDPGGKVRFTSKRKRRR